MNRILKKIMFGFYLLTIIYGCNKNEVLEVHSLTAEYLTNPIGIDKPQPLLGWQLSAVENSKYQKAYQILVASSLDSLDEHKGNIWDTQKVSFNDNINVEYNGKDLKSTSQYYWKVRVWDESDRVSDWSEPATWFTGLMNENDWKAIWISNKYAPVTSKREPFSTYNDSKTFVFEDTAAVYLRKEFSLEKKIKKAIVLISGLGYYELYLNGNKVGNHVLDPVFTDYQKTVKYQAYDATDFLTTGANGIGVILGNGFYNHQERDLFQMEKANWKTPPKLCFQLHLFYEDGCESIVTSNSSWRWSDGPIVYNSIRGGETVDSRIDIAGWSEPDFNDGYGSWNKVEETPAPKGTLSYQYMPPLRETKSFKPIAKWTKGKDTTIYDFGQNITGYADLKISGSKDETVNIFFNEVLNEDRTLNVKHSSGHTWGRFQHGKLILSGKETDIFEPRFTYHGFRYVQVTGVGENAVKSIQAKSVHTDLKEIGDFECSNVRLNELNAAIKRTLLNAVHSMPGEEATREKMGWTLDAGLATMESYLMNFDAINTYKKYLNDLIDSQEDNGHVPPIVPTNGWGFLEKNEQQKDTTIRFDDPWWGGTIAYVSEKLFQYTGDTAIIKQSYDPVKKYANFVLSTAEHDIVYWSLGDWLDLTHNQNGWGPGLTPIELTSTAANYYLCDRVSRNAALLNLKEEELIYRKHAERIKNAFNKKFLDNATGWYAKNSQTAQALPLYLGMVPENMEQKVVNRLLEAIENKGYHTSVGFIGVNPMLTWLSENGHVDIAYQIATQEESPGWLHFVKDSTSTMGENLNAKGYGTAHHPFASNIGYWLYQYLGGIQVVFSKNGAIILSPGFNSGLEWVNTSYRSLKGKIVSNWRKVENTIEYQVEIPANTTAILNILNKYRSNELDTQFTLINKDSEMKRYLIPSGNHNLTIIQDQ